MFLEKLVEYANLRLGQNLPPPGYQMAPIRYFVNLDSSGNAHGVIDTASKEEKWGGQRLAPHAKRGRRIQAKLLADNGEYVLGVARADPTKPPDPVEVARRQQAFRDIVAACARETGEPAVIAVAAFLDRHEPGNVPDWMPSDYDPGSTVTFRVDGVLPIDLEPVRAWWAKTRAPSDDDGDGMTCIGCGRVGPVLERHPLRIKGIPGGQAQKDLISANEAAFESYGLVASMTAPTCSACAEAYGNALNALLARDAKTRMIVGDLAYAFWTDPRQPVGFTPVDMLSKPEEHEAEVGQLLRAIFSGKDDALLIDPTAFYSVALGASGIRVVVKDWIDTTVGHARESIGRYFLLQQMVDAYGVPGPPMPFYYLTGATVRRGDTPPDIVTQSLIRLALHGNPLPEDLLYLSVRRNRAEQEVTRARAALIRMVLLSGMTIDELREGKMAQLDLTRTDAAYVCGRMLAIIDRIQWSALGDVNSSVIDKFFGSASANPASVFPVLLRGAQFHLNKLARDRSSTRVVLERQLEETSALLDDFPASLSLRDQGLFALGFYHQRAWDRAQAASRRANRDAGNDQPTDATEPAV